MEAADNCKVPAGSALAVDRVKFSSYVTDKIKNHPNIEIRYEEVLSINPNEITVIATGPLTSDAMANFIKENFVSEDLHFFDAAAPIVEFDSIDMSKAFFASRYNKGDADYINCPMSESEYNAFYNELVNAKEAELHEFDEKYQKLVGSRYYFSSNRCCFDVQTR